MSEIDALNHHGPVIKEIARRINALVVQKGLSPRLAASKAARRFAKARLSDQPCYQISDPIWGTELVGALADLSLRHYQGEPIRFVDDRDPDVTDDICASCGALYNNECPDGRSPKSL